MPFDFAVAVVVVVDDVVVDAAVGVALAVVAFASADTIEKWISFFFLNTKVMILN